MPSGMLSEINPPTPWANASLYIRDLAYQGDTPMNPPVRANASFISKIWHMRGTPPWTPRSEWTQALYWRFGISGEHLPEPLGPSERKLYIEDLAYQGDTLLNPPARANTSFISEIWHIRGAPSWTPGPSECLVKCSVKCLVECSMKWSVKCLMKCTIECSVECLMRYLVECLVEKRSAVCRGLQNVSSSKADKRKTANMMMTCSTCL